MERAEPAELAAPKLRGLPREEDPADSLRTLRGEVLASRGLKERLSFFAEELACRRTVARLPRISLGEPTGELLVRSLVWLPATAAGLGATAGGIVARFIGGE